MSKIFVVKSPNITHLVRAKNHSAAIRHVADKYPITATVATLDQLLGKTGADVEDASGQPPPIVPNAKDALTEDELLSALRDGSSAYIAEPEIPEHLRRVPRVAAIVEDAKAAE